MELKTWKMDIFHLFAALYSAEGVCKGHAWGQLRRENFDELQKASNICFQQIHETEFWFFFWRIYSFLVFGILVKSSGLVGLHFIVLPWWVTPRCKDFKECLKKILTLTMLCNVDNTHQLLHTNLISKVAGLLLDSGANSKLRNNQGLKKNNSQYLSIECINSRELGRPESIIFFIFFRENKASFPRTKKGRF